MPILGEGKIRIDKDEWGWHHGMATFAVRGPKNVCFRLLTTGADGVRRAEFVIVGVGCDTRFEVARSDTTWHGDITVEGYPMRVEIVKGGIVTFYNSAP